MKLSEILEKPRTASAKIYITQRDNERYFSNKFPTARDGFCYITRKVTIIPDPQEIWDDGEYGIIKASGKTLIVTGEPEEMEIWGEQSPVK